MAEFRFCPSCGSELGDFKFCPNCGAEMAKFVQEADPPTEPDTPARIADEGDTHPMETMKPAGKSTRAATKQGLGGAKAVVAGVKARVERKGSEANDTEAQRLAERAARTAPTVMQAAITPEQVAAAKARVEARADAKTEAAEAEAEAEAAKAPGADPGKKRRSDQFSETQWFMKGVSLDAAEVAEDGEVEATEEEYIHDESIPESKRRKFTLRKKHEE